MMAANAMHGTEEQPRLESAAEGYRALLKGIKDEKRSPLISTQSC